MAVDGRACMLTEPGAPAVVEDVSVGSPGPSEVIVRLAASGVCHGDLTVKVLKGDRAKLPTMLDHEGNRRARGHQASDQMGLRCGISCGNLSYETVLLRSLN